MANNLDKNVTAKLLRKFAPGFMSDLVFIRNGLGRKLAQLYGIVQLFSEHLLKTLNKFLPCNSRLRISSPA